MCLYILQASAHPGQSVWAAGPCVQVHGAAPKPLEGRMGGALAPTHSWISAKCFSVCFCFSKVIPGRRGSSKCPLHAPSLCSTVEG